VPRRPYWPPECQCQFALALSGAVPPLLGGAAASARPARCTEALTTFPVNRSRIATNLKNSLLRSRLSRSPIRPNSPARVQWDIATRWPFNSPHSPGRWLWWLDALVSQRSVMRSALAVPDGLPGSRRMNPATNPRLASAALIVSPSATLSMRSFPRVRRLFSGRFDRAAESVEKRPRRALDPRTHARLTRSMHAGTSVLFLTNRGNASIDSRWS
jgi:hypothetical protein